MIAIESRTLGITKNLRGGKGGTDLRGASWITCIYNLNSYLISLIVMLILYNYDACYLDFMNFLHLNAILLMFIFLHKIRDNYMLD